MIERFVSLGLRVERYFDGAYPGRALASLSLVPTTRADEAGEKGREVEAQPAPGGHCHSSHGLCTGRVTIVLMASKKQAPQNNK